MTFREALRHLDQGDFLPVYLITGEESFLVERFLRHFLKKALDPSAIGFNHNQFRGGEDRPETILSIANTFPLSSPRRTIFIQNADILKDDRGLLLAYLDQPAETTTLVFVAEKPDMRKKLFSALKKKGRVVSCPRPREKELPSWIREEAKKSDLFLSEEAVWFLQEHLGSNLLAIHQEIKKLALYHTDQDETAQQKVPIEVVQRVIANGRSHSVFELTKAVGNKDTQEAIRLVRAMLAEGAHALFILTMLVRLLRQMASAKALIDSGQAARVAKKVPMPPFLLQSFLQQLKKWKKEEITEGFHLSLSADSQIKGGGLSHSSILETLILDLCLGQEKVKGRSGYSLPFLSRSGS